MNSYHVSFDCIAPFTNEFLGSFNGRIEADNAELAVIFARDKVRKEMQKLSKATNVTCTQVG